MADDLELQRKFVAILPNLRVLPGRAVYRKPCVQRVLEAE
jgi:hypothetical protein